MLQKRKNLKKHNVCACISATAGTILVMWTAIHGGQHSTVKIISFGYIVEHGVHENCTCYNTLVCCIHFLGLMTYHCVPSPYRLLSVSIHVQCSSLTCFLYKCYTKTEAVLQDFLLHGDSGSTTAKTNRKGIIQIKYYLINQVIIKG